MSVRMDVLYSLTVGGRERERENTVTSWSFTTDGTHSETFHIIDRSRVISFKGLGFYIGFRADLAPTAGCKKKRKKKQKDPSAAERDTKMGLLW